MSQYLALRVRQPLVVDASHAIHDPDVTGLREEYVIIHEAPDREQRVHAARVAVVTKNAPDPHHALISRSTRSCFPGSWRRRAPDEARRIRSMSGSRFV